MKKENTAIEFIGASEKNYTVYSYLIRSLPGGEIIGDCCIRIGEGLDGIGNIGYTVDEAHRNEGHATRACALLLCEARALGLDNVSAVCEKGNAASVRVCEKLGGVPIGGACDRLHFCFFRKNKAF